MGIRICNPTLPSSSLRLPPEAGRLRSRFYQLQAIEKEWNEEDGSVGLQIRMPIIEWMRLCSVWAISNNVTGQRRFLLT